MAGEREGWLAMLADHQAALRMIRERLEGEMVGAMPSEERFLAPGWPLKEAEAVIVAIDRLAGRG